MADDHSERPFPSPGVVQELLSHFPHLDHRVAADLLRALDNNVNAAIEILMPEEPASLYRPLYEEQSEISTESKLGVMNSDETNEIDEETTSLSNTLGVTSTLDLLELMKLEIDKACQSLIEKSQREREEALHKQKEEEEKARRCELRAWKVVREEVRTMGEFARLPIDITEIIVGMVNGKGLGRLCLVCKSAMRYFGHNNFWLQRYKIDFLRNSNEQPTKICKGSWRINYARALIESSVCRIFDPINATLWTWDPKSGYLRSRDGHYLIHFTNSEERAIIRKLAPLSHPVMYEWKNNQLYSAGLPKWRWDPIRQEITTVDLAPRACITLKEVRHFPPRRVARLTYSTVPYVSRTGASFYSNRTWQIDGSVPIIAIVLVVMQRE